MNNIWLIGAGDMALEYMNILKDVNAPTTVIGRSQNSAKSFEDKTTINVITGGLYNFLQNCNEFCTHAIVAVGVEQLYDTTKLLLEAGVKNILVEKPGAINKNNLEHLKSIALQNTSNVVIGYNRRFYEATRKSQQIISEDGGVTSFNFEFTEWSHLIENIEKPKEVFETWFLGNSTHVVDLAFYLGGKPKEISCYTTGGLIWHNSSSVFAGAGISDSGALFSYQANWAAPGRWSVEILTKKHRLIFRPMEKLQIQKIGSVVIEEVELDYTLDQKYKPGLFEQVKNFLNNDSSTFCTLDYQIEIFDTYFKMANYQEIKNTK